jgi:hypothetical protein
MAWSDDEQAGWVIDRRHARASPGIAALAVTPTPASYRGDERQSRQFLWTALN